MHKEEGGNSGVFVWATPSSIKNLEAGKGRLPHGIEVQVLILVMLRSTRKDTISRLIGLPLMVMFFRQDLLR